MINRFQEKLILSSPEVLQGGASIRLERHAYLEAFLKSAILHNRHGELQLEIRDLTIIVKARYR